MKFVAEKLSILAVILLAAGVLWIRGPAITWPQVEFGLALIGAGIVVAGLAALAATRSARGRLAFAGSRVMLDQPLSTQEKAAVDRLTSEQVRELDLALLSACAPYWRNVPQIVSEAATTASAPSGLPDAFFGRRVTRLVADGRLESQGHAGCMALRQVRLAQAR